MEDKAHWNPVFAHLTRNARWPSARVTLGLVAGLMLASLALTVFLMARVDEIPQVGFHPIDILTLAIWGLHIVMLLVAAPVAAILTVRETEDETFQLLRGKPSYSPGNAVRGLVLAVLYRLRVLLVLMVVLSPMVVVEHYRSEKAWVRDPSYVFVSRDLTSEEMLEMIDGCATNTADLPCIEPSDSSLLLWSLYLLLFPVGLWGATLFSTALAVWLALWRGRVGWVWAYLVGWLLCVLVVLTLLGPIFGTNVTVGGAIIYYHITIKTWPPHVDEAVVLFSVMFYMLAWGAMRLARRWA